MSSIEALFLDHLIVRAERVLADRKAAGLLSRDALWIFEGVISRMYEERRVVLENMMQRAFSPAKSNA